MLKLIGLIFVAFWFFSCSTDTGEKITGTWQVEKMYLDTSDVSMQNLQGRQRWITFNEDGSLESDEFSGTWDYNDEDQVLTINNTDAEDSYFRWLVEFKDDKMLWNGLEGDEAERMRVQLVRTNQQFKRDTTIINEEPMPAVRDTADLRIDKAIIDSINVIIMKSLPVQVTVVVMGYLSDGCTTIHRVDRRQEGNTFIIDVFTERPKEAMCTQALVLFEQNVPLDVEELSAGTYKVIVHDKETTFTLNGQ